MEWGEEALGICGLMGCDILEGVRVEVTYIADGHCLTAIVGKSLPVMSPHVRADIALSCSMAAIRLCTNSSRQRLATNIHLQHRN